MPPNDSFTHLPLYLLNEGVNHLNPVEACLEELAKVRGTFSRLQARGGASQQQVRELIIHAQDVLGLLEVEIWDDPVLVHAQVCMLEARILSNHHRLGEAMHTACSCLKWLLKSIQAPRK